VERALLLVRSGFDFDVILWPLTHPFFGYSIAKEGARKHSLGIKVRKIRNRAQGIWRKIWNFAPQLARPIVSSEIREGFPESLKNLFK
jgi:hypothetical protein